MTLNSTVNNLTHWHNKRVLVMGLGRFGGGIGVTRYLTARGARVTVTDQADETALNESVEKISDLKVDLHLGAHQESDFTNTDIIVVNPAVRKDSPWLKLARNHNTPLTSEMNIFLANCPAQIIGITGSNGKSTTTAMIGHILQKHGPTWIGGNIGRENLLEKVDQIMPDHKVVLELSSFQLHDLQQLKRSPHIAVVTNIAPNHLDWHGSMAHYIAAKQNMLQFQRENDVAILNQLDPEVSSWKSLTPGTVIYYPNHRWERLPLPVPGRHNQLNASAAIAVANVEGIDSTQAIDDLQDFQSLPHRLELVREMDGIRFYNDSIATTPESAIAAIEAFAEPKTLILGGYDKGVSFTELAEKLVEKVEIAILLGKTREILVDEIEKIQQKMGKNTPRIIRVDTFEDTIRSAHQAVLHYRQISPGNNKSPFVVLLSPACASYDMFDNFQQRGETFRELVHKLSFFTE